MINMASDHFAHCVTHLLQLVHEWLSILAFDERGSVDAIFLDFAN